jgi:hypothetical protein
MQTQGNLIFSGKIAWPADARLHIPVSIGHLGIALTAQLDGIPNVTAGQLRLLLHRHTQPSSLQLRTIIKQLCTAHASNQQWHLLLMQAGASPKMGMKPLDVDKIAPMSTFYKPIGPGRRIMVGDHQARAL